MTQPKIYKGLDLLDKIFEFVEMTPDRMKWNLAALKTNPPRYIRLQQIEALLKAFFEQKNVTLLEKTKALFTDKQRVTIQSILLGDFIKQKSREDYTELITFMEGIVQKNEISIDKQREIHLQELIMPYQQLIKYKQQLTNLLTFNCGWLEAGSISSRFSIYLTDAISKNLVGKYTDLNLALELFINPKHVSFSEEELKTQYKYPSTNLIDIDMDYV